MIAAISARPAKGEGLMARDGIYLLEKEEELPRRGDGIYLRGGTWWLDFMHDGRRAWPSFNRTAAGEEPA